MAESKSYARVKKTLESSKELTKTSRENVDKERDKILEAITNDIVESRIDEKESMLKALAELFNETENDAINALKLAEDLEKRKLSEEYESIVKKQLQILQADERGKQALLTEISNIKQEQRKRSDALKARKKALVVEKERAKRIAALPPPLPKSVKLLLKEQEKKESETLRCFNPSPSEELYPVEEEEIDVFEDKENMDDEMYQEERRRQQEIWDRKAKRRFNEAIRKKRLEQEHAEILKEIENADKTNRREMARNISEPSGKVPSALSDRLNHMEKQAVLEDKVEGIFKRPNAATKEHAIEDLEGYEDKWEAKYKRIDSNLEAKLIDCVPDFVKHNYSYLLEEEPLQPCGNRFGRSEESDGDLNVAYIESPTDRITSSNIAAVISHLDQMMSETNEVYETKFKPLLEAELLKAEQPKLESVDKAVEADILKRPTEDKSTGVQEETPSPDEIFASRGTQADFMNRGVMAFRRRIGSKFKPYLEDLSNRDLPGTWVEPETVPSNSSWSSSSYRSLQSRFGQPEICNLCDSPSCKLPLVEGQHRNCVPMSKSRHQVQEEPPPEEKGTMSGKISEHESSARKTEPEGPRNIEEASHSQEDISGSSSTSLDDKSKVLSFVQLIAQNYLKKQQEELEASHENEAIEKEAPERAISGSHVGSRESESKAVPKQSHSERDESKDSKTLQAEEISEEPKDQFAQRCHEILSEKLSNLFTEDEAPVQEEGKKKLTPGDFVYHELSTIMEMDSALTNDLPSLRDASKKTSRSSSLSSLSRKSEEVDTSLASLVDVPVSEAAELAKSIHFVAEPSESVVEPQTPLGLISGTLTSIQTPSPQVGSEVPESKTPKESESTSFKFLKPKTPNDFEIPAQSTPKPNTLAEDLDTPSQVTIRSDISTPSTLKNFSGSTLKSKNLLTPTSQVSSTRSGPSESVEITPYSSSHRFANLKYPFLTNLTEDLPQYFKDISSINQDSGPEVEKRPADNRQTVPKTLSTSRQLFFPGNFEGKFQTDENSSGSFKPMTPHSYVSSPGAIYTEPDKPNDGQFQKEGSSSNSFKPMTPHSYVPSLHSKPSIQSKNGYGHKEDNLDKFAKEETSSGSFKPMTPHSYVSSQDGNLQHREPNYNNQVSGSLQGSFKPMTPHSYLSSPGAIHAEYGPESKNAQNVELKPPKSKNEPLHSTENSQVSYKPMSRSYMPSPIEDQRDRQGPPRDFLEREKSPRKQATESRRTEGNQLLMTDKPSKFLQGFNGFGSESQNDQPRKQSPTKKRPVHVAESDGSESDVSTPRTISPSRKIRDWMAGPDDLLTPHYRISTPHHPSQTQGLAPESKDQQLGGKAWTSPKSSVDDFQPMATHSLGSGLNSLGTNQSSEKKSRILSPLQNKHDGSDEGFQPMTPHTYRSAPDLGKQESDNQRSAATENSNGFQPMTPHSYISSEENMRAGSLPSVNLRLRIPTGLNQIQDSQAGSSRSKFEDKARDFQNRDADAQYFTLGDGLHMQQPIEFVLKNNVYDELDDKISKLGNGNEVHLGMNDEHKAVKVPRSDFFIPQYLPADFAKGTQGTQQDFRTNSVLRNEKLGDPSDEKNAVKVTRSNFFVPQLSEADLAVQQKFQDLNSQVQPKVGNSKAHRTPNGIPRTHKGYFSSDISDVSSMRSLDLKTCIDSTPSASSLTSSLSSVNTKDLMRLGGISSMEGSVSSLTSGLSSVNPKELLKPTGASSIRSLEVKTGTDSIPSASSLTPSSLSSAETKELLRLAGASSMGGSSSLSSLGSETPHFSVNSPNPILEALRKKFASDPSSKVSSLYSSPLSTQGALSDISVSKVTSQSTPIKTVEEIIQETGILDEPDLTLVTTNLTIMPGSPGRSRLFSENRSLQQALPTPSEDSKAVTPTTAAGSSYAESPSMMSFLQHERSCLGDSKNGGRQFARNKSKPEYQQRTRRLWNNLEEVKTKKMLEEKKKQIAENRQKMKAYTRVYKKP